MAGNDVTRKPHPLEYLLGIKSEKSGEWDLALKSGQSLKDSRARMTDQKKEVFRMQRITSWLIILAYAFSLLLSQGCAATIDRPFIQKDPQKLSPLRVIRYKTPELQKATPGDIAPGLILGTLITAPLFIIPPLGGAALGGVTGAMTEAKRAGAGKQLRESLGLPDFGEVVMKKFVERAGKELPELPAMAVQVGPVEETPLYESGAFLELKVDSVVLVVASDEKAGFGALVTAALNDFHSNVLWQKRVNYAQSLDAATRSSRGRPLKEFEADNGKLLKEEMDFAAETLVSNLIAHFKGEEKKP